MVSGMRVIGQTDQRPHSAQVMDHIGSAGEQNGWAGIGGWGRRRRTFASPFYFLKLVLLGHRRSQL